DVGVRLLLVGDLELGDRLVVLTLIVELLRRLVVRACVSSVVRARDRAPAAEEFEQAEHRARRRGDPEAQRTLPTRPRGRSIGQDEYRPRRLGRPPSLPSRRRARLAAAW